MELILFWFGLAVIVGVAASSRGRSGFAWFLLAVVISPLLAGLLVLVMPSVRRQEDAAAVEAVAASQNASQQMMYDALPDDAKERVRVAQAERQRAALYPDTNDLNDTELSRIRAAQFTYYDAVGHTSVQLVFDLLNDSENAPEEQRRFDRLIAAEVRQAFKLAATALIRPLHAARAEHRLEAGIRFRLKGEDMSKQFASERKASPTTAWAFGG